MYKRKKLPDAIDAVMESGDFDAFCRIMKKCEPNALTIFGHNAFVLPNLTEQHIRWLIEYGTIINSPNYCGATPLSFIASLAGRHEIIDLLIRYGADIHQGFPLHAAAAQGHVENMQVLLRNGASADEHNAENLTPLEYALSHIAGAGISTVADAIVLLIQSGAAVSEKARAELIRAARSAEFYRERYSPEVEQEVDEAMERLYPLFGVEPAPRRILHDGHSPIRVPDGAWQDQFSALWELLVPGSGACRTVQGELIRIIGKIGHELLDNGGGNWDREYRLMLDWFSQTLAETTALTEAEKDDAARRIRELTQTDKTEEHHEELSRLTVKWILNTPDPLPLGETKYRR